MGMFEKVIQENNYRQEIYDEVVKQFKSVVDENMQELKQLFSDVHYGLYYGDTGKDLNRLLLKTPQHIDYLLAVTFDNNIVSLTLFNNPYKFPYEQNKWIIDNKENARHLIETFLKQTVSLLLNIKVDDKIN